MRGMKKVISSILLTMSLFVGVIETGVNNPAFASQQEKSNVTFENFAVKKLGDDNFALEFRTSIPLKVQVSYGATQSKELFVVKGPQGINHHVKLDGLKSNMKYIAVLSVNEGKTILSETIFFETSSQPKVIVPRNEVGDFAESIDSSNVSVLSHDIYESEYNGEMGYADSLPPTTPLYGFVSSGTDVDWFSVNVTANTNGKLNVFMDVPAEQDYELELYNSYGTQIASSVNGTGVDELISRTGTSPGQYYAKVRPYNGSSSSSATYMIRWKFYPDIAWPVPGSDKITDTFGTPRSDGPHKGLDISWWDTNQTWKYEIQAVKNGTVTYSSTDQYSTAGWWVQVDHGLYNGKKLIARYLHMESQPLVSYGNTVSSSQRLGWMGYTGDVDPVGPNGKHLHLDFSDGYNYYDPLPLLTKPQYNELIDYWESNSSLKQ